jgi:hypothetical protein
MGIVAVAGGGVVYLWAVNPFIRAHAWKRMGLALLKILVALTAVMNAVTFREAGKGDTLGPKTRLALAILPLVYAFVLFPSLVYFWWWNGAKFGAAAEARASDAPAASPPRVAAEEEAATMESAAALTITNPLCAPTTHWRVAAQAAGDAGSGGGEYLFFNVEDPSLPPAMELPLGGILVNSLWKCVRDEKDSWWRNAVTGEVAWELPEGGEAVPPPPPLVREEHWGPPRPLPSQGAKRRAAGAIIKLHLQRLGGKKGHKG